MWDLSRSGIGARLLHWLASSLAYSWKPCQVISYCPFHTVLLERIQYVQPMLKEQGFMLLPLRMGVHKLFGILLHGRFFFSFMYSIIYLCKYGLLHIYYTLGYNPMLLYWFCCSDCSNFEYWRVGGGCPSVGYHRCGHLGFSVTQAINSFSLSQFKWGFLSFVTTGFLTALQEYVSLQYLLNTSHVANISLMSMQLTDHFTLERTNPLLGCGEHFAEPCGNSRRLGRRGWVMVGWGVGWTDKSCNQPLS